MVMLAKKGADFCAPPLCKPNPHCRDWLRHPYSHVKREFWILLDVVSKGGYHLARRWVQSPDTDSFKLSRPSTNYKVKEQISLFIALSSNYRDNYHIPPTIWCRNYLYIDFHLTFHVIVILSGSTNCFYIDFRLLAYEGHALVSQADTLFGNGCDKDWIRYGIIMVWIKTSWSPWSGLREGATTTINAAQHHRQLLPLWTGLIVVVTIIGLESFGKSLDLQILPPPPPHKRTKEKSCTVFYGSSCWLRHHPDTVEAPSTATTTAWAPPWLLRQWFSLFVVL